MSEEALTPDGQVEASVTDEQLEQMIAEEGAESVEGEEASKTEKADKSEKKEVKEKKEDKVVPYGALHEERQKRKELEKRIREAEAQSVEKMQRMEAALQEVMKRVAPKKEDEIPDVTKDPIQHFQKQLQLRDQELAEIRQQLAAYNQSTQQTSQWQQFIGSYQAAASEFASRTPDFMNAYSHLVSDRVAEFQEAGYSRQEAMQLASEDEARIVSKAFQDGENPAERLYALAKRRGYKPPKSEAEAEQEEEVQTRLKTVKKGVDSTRDLRGKPSPALSLESLAEIEDPEEFDKAFEKLIGQG